MQVVKLEPLVQALVSVNRLVRPTRLVVLEPTTTIIILEVVCLAITRPLQTHLSVLPNPRQLVSEHPLVEDSLAQPNLQRQVFSVLNLHSSLQVSLDSKIIAQLGVLVLERRLQHLAQQILEGDSLGTTQTQQPKRHLASAPHSQLLGELVLELQPRAVLVLEQQLQHLALIIPGHPYSVVNSSSSSNQPLRAVHLVDSAQLQLNQLQVLLSLVPPSRLQACLALLLQPTLGEDYLGIHLPPTLIRLAALPTTIRAQVIYLVLPSQLRQVYSEILIRRPTPEEIPCLVDPLELKTKTIISSQVVTHFLAA
jgi:hypothetical protein